MKIVTDCAADMPVNELTDLGIVQAPLFIHFPDGEINSAEISADDFYNRLEAMRPAIPTTAQPSSGVFTNIYRSLAASGERILSVHISSGLSGTFNSAQLGKAEVGSAAGVTVWDSLTLSGGQRFQVMAAALMARAGWSEAAILERLADIRARTEVIYTLETLEYLARGGRIGRVQALMGSVLKIKPLIRVAHEDGKYSTVAKTRTISSALSMIGDHLQGLFGQTAVWLTVLHGRFGEQAHALEGQLNSQLKVARSEVLRISPVLGVHTGPGIVGAALLPMALMEDLF